MNLEEATNWLTGHTKWTWEYQDAKTAAWEFIVTDDTGRSTKALIPFTPDDKKLQKAIHSLHDYFAFFTDAVKVKDAEAS